jgi:ribosomal protein S18 acetylase RimI-like enzyme
MSGADLDSLRRRAQDAPVGTAEGLALNREILRHAPADLAAANRLGRGLEEVGRGAEALAVFEQTLELRPGDAWVAARVEHLRAVVAVRKEGTPVAFAQLERVGPAAELTQVYVHPEHRGGGHGTAVTRAAIEAAQDVRDLWIAADDDDRAKQLYARLGFRSAWTTMEFLRLP